MANANNVNQIIRNFKNAPVAASNTERVMLELRVDKDTVFRRATISETVSLAAAASANLTTQLPAGAKVIESGYFLTTAMVLVTAVKLGIGVSGKPSAFGLSGTTMTINTTEGLPTAPATPADATVAAATTMRVSTVDTNGAAAGTGTGTVKVCVVYEYMTSLAA